MSNNETVDESLIVGDKLNPAMEQALRLMEQSDELTEQDIAQLLADDDSMRLTQELWTVKQAIDRTHAKLPDIEQEWQRVNPAATARRRANIKPYVRYIVAAAAAILLLVVFTLHRHPSAIRPDSGEYVAYKASPAQRDIVITSDQGNSVVVNKQSVSALGSEVSQTDELTIAYQQLNTNIVESHTATIPEGKTFKVVLSDGSEVWLNAGSRLVYPTQFIGSSREVQLEGEAYFKVAHDARHPFIVKAGDVYTRVLGTEFNIRMKQQPPASASGSQPSACPYSYEITLVSGKISLTTGSPEPSTGSRPVVLTPGMQAVMETGSSAFDLKEVDTDLYSYWKEGFFFFDDEPLETIMKQIGSWYNVNVVFRNPKNCNIRMHFFCDHNGSVAQVVEQLNMLQKVSVTFSKDTIYID